jgi:hypothetical protein
MLPTRARDLDFAWRKDLFDDYEDYGKVISHEGNRALKWYKKFSFSNP